LIPRFTPILGELRPLAIAVCLLLPIWPGAALALDGVTLLQTGPGVARFAVDVARPAVESAPGSSTQAVVLPGFDLDGRPGEPALPSRVIVVAVPPTGTVSVQGLGSEIEWRDGVRLAPISRSVSGQGVEVAATSVTPEIARLIDVSWLRDQRVARVLIRPSAYDGRAQRLGTYRRVEVEVRFENVSATPPAERTRGLAERTRGLQDGFESVYANALVNLEQGRAWRRGATATGRVAGLASARAASVVPDTSLFAHRKWVKIAIPQTGFYRVHFGQLRNSGLFGGSDSVSVDSLRLFVWPGTPVLPEESYCDSCAYREVAVGIVDDNNGKFDNNNDDYFYFYGLGPSDWVDLYAGPQDPAQPDTVFLNHPYEIRNFYYLTVATAADPVPGAPRRIVAESGALTDTVGATRPATFDARAHFEVDQEFHPDATPRLDASGNRLPEFWEKWFWTTITNSSASLFRESVDLPGLEPSLPTRLRLRVWGLNDMPSTDHSLDKSDHYLFYQFGNVDFTGLRGWDRLRPLTVDTTVIGLTETGNVLTARVPSAAEIGELPALQGRRNDQVGVAWFDIFYPRRFVPVGNELVFDSDPSWGKTVYDIGPFTVGSNSLRIFDVTDPYQPIEILQPEVTTTSGGSRVRFNRVESGLRRYRIIPDDRIVKPLNTDVVDAAGSDTNLRAGPGADYLVIYFDAFASAAQELTDWRKDHLPLVGVAPPYGAMKVAISAIYDQFSGGRMDPGAVRNFLRAAYFNWGKRPTFVTLLGDASSDFKNLTGAALPGEPGALIPSYEGGFDFALDRQFATDDWMLNVDDPTTVIPDFLGGRIPGRRRRASHVVRSRQAALLRVGGALRRVA
jgi:hypothetical protein